MPNGFAACVRIHGVPPPGAYRWPSFVQRIQLRPAVLPGISAARVPLAT
jgi:hypothetical protein